MQNTNLPQFSSRIAMSQYCDDRPRHQIPVQPIILNETSKYMDGLDQEEEFDSDSGDKDEKSGLSDHLGKKSGKKTRGRVKIKMEFIQNKLRRYTTFSKRKTGIMKKAYELSTLTGTQVMLLVASETGHVYTFATRKLQPMITSESGKALIQTCLNSPDPTPTHSHQPCIQQPQTITPLSLEMSPTQVNLPAACVQRMSQTGYEETDLQYSNGEEDMKTTTSTAGPVQYNNQSAQSYSMTPNDQSNPTKPASYSVQPMGSITTIFTPAGVASNNSTVQIQNAQAVTQEQPQILCGQLQLHRIHPQNIILTGNSGVQSNHILLNHVNDGHNSHIVNDGPQVVSSESHTDILPPSSQHEVITFGNPEVSSGTQLQMLYNPGGVMYASSSRTLKRSDSQNSSDVVTLQHTPVIQKSGLQQHDSEMLNRTIVEENARISGNSQNDMLK